MLQVLSDSAIILNRCCLFSFLDVTLLLFFESLLVTVLDKTDVFVMVVFIIVF